jgi:single-strand DNA-binding protein
VQQETVWFRVSVWGKQAEVCNQYLSKGRQVLVEGRLTAEKETGGPRIWTDQNGKPRASYEVSAFEVRFLGTRADGGGGNLSGGPAAGVEDALTEDEIPF